MVLANPEEVRNRWKKCYEKLLNEENPRVVLEDGVPNQGVTPIVSRGEVKQALNRMKNGKATGPDKIPAEVWKSLGEEGIDILWDLMKKVFEQEKIPEEWRGSIITVFPSISKRGIYKIAGTIEASNCLALQ